MPDWITTSEAAELSGYDVQYIRRMIRSGAIKAEKRGRDWWVHHRAFLEYLRTARQSQDKRRGPRG